MFCPQFFLYRSRPRRGFAYWERGQTASLALCSSTCYVYHDEAQMHRACRFVKQYHILGVYIYIYIQLSGMVDSACGDAYPLRCVVRAKKRKISYIHGKLVSWKQNA